MLGALVVGVAVAFALVVSGGGEGTVVDKIQQSSYDRGCNADGIPTGPVAVPVWGVCSVPRCWRLVVRDGDGDTFEPCVSREEYERTQIGAFWHGRTDR